MIVDFASTRAKAEGFGFVGYKWGTSFAKRGQMVVEIDFLNRLLDAYAENIAALSRRSVREAAP